MGNSGNNSRSESLLTGFIQVEWKRYARCTRGNYLFKKGEGFVNEREGIILRARRADGEYVYGEIAPLEGFGTEDVSADLCFLEENKGILSINGLGEAYSKLPALWATIKGLVYELNRVEPLAVRQFQLARLVDFDDEASVLDCVRDQVPACKIKANGFHKMLLVKYLCEFLGSDAALRIDFNGRLEAVEWGKCADFLSKLGHLDYVEQPMAVGCEWEMQAIGERYGVIVALDESIRTVEDIQYFENEGWRGYYVVKLSIMADWDQLNELSAAVKQRIIYSSCLETGIGVEMALRRIPNGETRAVGFGISTVFTEDGLSCHEKTNTITSGRMTAMQFEEIWKLLS